MPLPGRKSAREARTATAIVDYGQLDSGFGQRARLSGDDRSLARQRDGPSPRHGVEPHEPRPAENLWWNDVPGERPRFTHAAFFDIDWRPIKDELQDRVLLPILGGQYGQVLESGDLKLEYRDGAFFLAVLPVAPAHRPADVPSRSDAGAGQR